MAKFLPCVVAVGSAVLVVSAGFAAAQDDVRASTPFALEQAACTAQARPVEELATVVASPFPETSVRAMATVAALLGDDRIGFVPPAGKPADAATAQSVVVTVREFYACLASGDQLAAASLATDDYLRSQIIVSTEQGDGPNGASPATPVPDLVLGTQARVTEVHELADDRAGAVVEFALLAGADRTDYVLLREQGGRYLVEGTVEGFSASATPTSRLS